jgi:hypothetical protein
MAIIAFVLFLFFVLSDLVKKILTFKELKFIPFLGSLILTGLITFLVGSYSNYIRSITIYKWIYLQWT